MSEENKQAETNETQTEETKKTGAVNETETSEKTEETSEKTFTQSELDEIISKRIERERNKFSDYDEIKAKASEYEKKLEEQRLAELSEKERAEEIAKKAEEEKASYAKQLEELRESIKREKVNNEFIKLATSEEYGIQYVDDAMKLADSELSALELDEKGNVSGVEDIVKSLVENKPFLLAQQKPKRPVGDPTNLSGQQDSDKTAEQLLKEAEDKARKTGRIEDRVAASKLKRELNRY